MKYISTRGQAPALDFQEVLLAGLASDGGLYVPQTIPSVSSEQLREWCKLDYSDLALEVMTPFVGDTIARDTLKEMIDESYRSFSHRAVAPLVQLGANKWVLELFHGPTLAFKDFALQLLGRLLDYTLTRQDEQAVIVGATSGDTGSAAIEGCRHSDRVSIFMMHPHQRISAVQRRQMTTLLGDNIHNLAVNGNFDDCQALVKACFAEQDFLQGRARLVAVNSINWARIMAQVVYYFYAALALGAPDRPVSFSVPTGNFGDIFAGLIAHTMGLPIEQLIVATNSNDILHRFFNANNYLAKPLQPTLAPSMDIMVSSNFERLLFELHERDGAKVKALMQDFQAQGQLKVEDVRWRAAAELFASARVSDQDAVATIARYYAETGYLLDPHSAIGVAAADQTGWDLGTPMVTLATAHPVKFPQALTEAGLTTPPLPPHLADLHEREERLVQMENNLASLQDYICANASVLKSSL